MNYILHSFISQPKASSHMVLFCFILLHIFYHWGLVTANHFKTQNSKYNMNKLIFISISYNCCDSVSCWWKYDDALVRTSELSSLINNSSICFQATRDKRVGTESAKISHIIVTSQWESVFFFFFRSQLWNLFLNESFHL